MTIISFINSALSLLVVLSNILLIFVVVCFIFFRKKLNSIFDFIGKNGLLFAFIVSLVATLGSLFYSEIAGYEPCKLCWLQRIFMYPQTILLGIALWRKDRNIGLYGLVLSIIGGLIAGYHYVMQLGLVPSLPCSAVGYSVSCTQRFVLQFGYITMPMMAFTAFTLIIVSLFFYNLHNKNI